MVNMVMVTGGCGGDGGGVVVKVVVVNGDEEDMVVVVVMVVNGGKNVKIKVEKAEGRKTWEKGTPKKGEGRNRAIGNTQVGGKEKTKRETKQLK